MGDGGCATGRAGECCATVLCLRCTSCEGAILGQVEIVDEDEGLYTKHSLCCLHRDKFPRKQVISLVDNVWFDRVVISVILANCVTLAM